MKARKESRRRGAYEGGHPVYARIYGKDRVFTISFVGDYRGKQDLYAHMEVTVGPDLRVISSALTYSQDRIDGGPYAHLGRKLTFRELPREVKTEVLEEYGKLWGTVGDICDACKVRRQSVSLAGWQAEGGCSLPGEHCKHNIR